MGIGHGFAETSSGMRAIKERAPGSLQEFSRVTNMNRITPGGRDSRVIDIRLCIGARPSAREVAVDLSGYDSRCGVAVVSDHEKLTMRWPMENGEVGQVVLDLRDGQTALREILPSRAKAGEAVPPGAPGRRSRDLRCCRRAPGSAGIGRRR